MIASVMPWLEGEAELEGARIVGRAQLLDGNGALFNALVLELPPAPPPAHSIHPEQWAAAMWKHATARPRRVAVYWRREPTDPAGRFVCIEAP